MQQQIQKAKDKPKQESKFDFNAEKGNLQKEVKKKSQEKAPQEKSPKKEQPKKQKSQGRGR